MIKIYFFILELTKGNVNKTNQHGRKVEKSSILALKKPRYLY